MTFSTLKLIKSFLASKKKYLMIINENLLYQKHTYVGIDNSLEELEKF